MFLGSTKCHPTLSFPFLVWRGLRTKTSCRGDLRALHFYAHGKPQWAVHPVSARNSNAWHCFVQEFQLSRTLRVFFRERYPTMGLEDWFHDRINNSLEVLIAVKSSPPQWPSLIKSWKYCLDIWCHFLRPFFRQCRGCSANKVWRVHIGSPGTSSSQDLPITVHPVFSRLNKNHRK